ncbi:MAG: hypothetical protein LBD30_05720 [Verrucomicrobiales bacterium]|nr:hypothetical protein [Verrucomicrobiales bacterium]
MVRDTKNKSRPHKQPANNGADSQPNGQRVQTDRQRHSSPNGAIAPLALLNVDSP